MLFSIVALLAIVGIAISAAPAAQSTYCHEDNLLRAFQHTPTPASSYCKTATGRPTFLAVTSYPASRLSSACSCFSRFPTDPTVPAPTPACKPNTIYRFVSSTVMLGDPICLIITIDRGQSCGSGGYRITNLIGTLINSPITFDTSQATSTSIYNCYFPDSDPPLNAYGLTFTIGTSYPYFIMAVPQVRSQINGLLIDGPTVISMLEDPFFWGLDCGSPYAVC